jgi:hypothetical protein
MCANAATKLRKVLDRFLARLGLKSGAERRLLMLHPFSARELEQLARRLGCEVLRGELQYPGPQSNDWEIGGQAILPLLYGFRNRHVILIVAEAEQEPAHLCPVCGYELTGPGELCPRCAQVDNEIAASLKDASDVIDEIEDWLHSKE